MKLRLLHSIFILVLLTTCKEMIAQKDKTIQIHWKVATSLPASPGHDQALGQAGALAGIHNNTMIIAGGANFPGKAPWLGGKKMYYNDAFVYQKGANEVISRLGTTWQLPFPTAYGASCSTPMGVVYAGGENESGISNKVILVQWDAVGKTIIITELPSLPFAVTNATAACIGSKVYLVGGETQDGGVSSKFLSLDLSHPLSAWSQLADLPKAVSHTVMVVQSNGEQDLIYVMGGRKRNNGGISDLYASVYSYDLLKNKWHEKRSLPYALSAGTGVALGKNGVLLFGGDKGETFHKAESLIAAINAEKNAAKKEELNQQKIEVQSTHPGFSPEVLLYNTAKEEWTKVGCIPFEVPVTTTALKWDDLVIIPSGEIKAGIRTPQILSGKLTVNP